MPDFPVESINVRAFAQAIGDHDPVHVDPGCADAMHLGGLAAPLTFVLAAAQVDPDYPLRPRDDRPWHGSGATGGHTNPLGEGLLHAGQTFDYHRPVLVGDVLTADDGPWRSWEKVSSRGGVLLFQERVTIYRDPDGSPVVTATARTVIPQSAPDQGG